MKHLITTLLLLICFFASPVFSQSNFEVPAGYELKAKEDYARYESAIVEAAKWLEETDLDKEKAKRQEVNTFLIQWISGSPDVSIEIHPAVADLYGKNEQLLAVYMAGAARYQIENKGSADRMKGIKAGIVSMSTVYKKGIAVKKVKELDKLLKFSDTELDAYIAEKIK
jgi:hypothetical protein